MLRWEKDINGYNGHWMGGYIGFDDDCPLYKVGEDDNGWYYEYLPDADGMDGYDTAEEAKAAAEFEFTANQIKVDWESEEPLSLEDIDEILGDMLYDERKENAQVGW